uniref:acyl-CoA (8-3)-desaturase n=1 Tax=Gasterosteus aculeatus aculeatus TaxID=481459 RepID=A0AAQ4QZJ7_GASAC
MGGGGQLTEPAEEVKGRAGGVYTWQEVQSHCSRSDQWLVIDRKVYNITQWAKRHPGGIRVISHYAGEDATEAFTAFHPDLKWVQKFLKPLLIGELAATEPSQDRNKSATIIQDFHTLRAKVESEGLFRARPSFFCFHLGHILLLEALAWLIIWVWGTSWTLTLLSAFLLATSQVTPNIPSPHAVILEPLAPPLFLNKPYTNIKGLFSQGASANWWNHRHYQHHAKPNVFSKDPDVNMLHLFVIGKTQPVEYGIKKIKYMPYHHQHQYFFLVGPPLLIPIYFHIQIMRSMISRHDWVDLACSLSHYLRYLCCSVPLYGLLGSMLLISFVRILESHCFVWVTQMNHLPMNIDHEKHQDWLSMQLHATCNVKQSPFNDWFSGHLNFQIEHHLFPTMPRHNYHLVAPQVRALCDKHGIPYQVKTMWQGFADVFRSLKNSGDLWLDAYLHK